MSSSHLSSLNEQEQTLVKQGNIKAAVLHLRERCQLSLKSAYDMVEAFRIAEGFIIPPITIGQDCTSLTFSAYLLFTSTVCHQKLATCIGKRLACDFQLDRSGRFEEFISYIAKPLGLNIMLQLNDQTSQQYILEITPAAKAEQAKQYIVDLSQHIATLLADTKTITQLHIPSAEV